MGLLFQWLMSRWIGPDIKKYFLHPFVLSLLLTLVLSSLQGLRHSGVGKEEGEQDTLSRIQLSAKPDPGCNSIIRWKKSSIPGHD